jgi:hypothetical protein
MFVYLNITNWNTKVITNKISKAVPFHCSALIASSEGVFLLSSLITIFHVANYILNTNKFLFKWQTKLKTKIKNPYPPLWLEDYFLPTLNL